MTLITWYRNLQSCGSLHCIMTYSSYHENILAIILSWELRTLIIIILKIFHNLKIPVPFGIYLFQKNGFDLVANCAGTQMNFSPKCGENVNICYPECWSELLNHNYTKLLSNNYVSYNLNKKGWSHEIREVCKWCHWMIRCFQITFLKIKGL
jgi:hypothetical protein